ncbi:MAG: tetratricopeptide repeat protein [Isosphaeraceae bacterium]
MNELSRKRHVKTRTNWTAAILLSCLVLAVVSGLYLVNMVQERRLSREALATAQRLEKDGEIDVAMRHLSQYLAMHPADADALELKTRLMEKVATSPAQALDVARAYDQLLRLQPGGQYAQKARRRLVEQYVRYGDLIKQSAVFFEAMPGMSALEARYQAAETHARELIRRGADDAEAHRLLAMALDGLAVPANPAALDAAIKEYRRTLEIDPKDQEAARRLARLYLEKMKDEARAERVLDDLLRNAPNSVDVRLLRHAFYKGLHADVKAAAELEVATKLAPEDLRVLLNSAEDALRRGDVPDARRQFAKVPEKFQKDPRFLMLQGQADFSDELPDEAVATWRQGLLSTSGTDAELTWWLAYAMLQMGRMSEARPLISQYRRLAGESPVYGILIALLFEKAGRPTRAIQILQGLTEPLGDRWGVLVELALGRCYEAIWDDLKAATAYRAALKIDDAAVVPRLALAKLLLKKKPDEAIAELRHGLAKQPADPAMRVALAGAILQQQASRPEKQRNWEDFAVAFRQAAESSPRSSAVALLQADWLNLQGRPDEALEFLQTAVKQAPRSAPIAMALADALTRRGKLPLALEVLEKASTKEAAGDQASLRIARARLLTALNRGRAARQLLVNDLDRLPPSDRHMIWVALGQLETEQGDAQAARLAYSAWSALVPEDPRPRLLLVELALNQNDEAGARKALDELGAACETSDIAYRLARAKVLLAERDAANPAPGSRDVLLEEAARLVTGVLDDAPLIPSAQFLKAQILERQGKIDDAVAAYERQWERGLDTALPRIIELLIRRRRFDELMQVRTTIPQATAKVDLLSSAALLRAGEQTQANRMGEFVAADLKNSIEGLGWQARMLNHMGRFDDAESALRAVAERRATEPEPWLMLIQYQAAHQRTQAARETVDHAKSVVKTDRPDVFHAKCLWALNDRTASDAAFRELLEKNPRDTIVLAEASRYYEETNRLGEAERLLNTLREVDPKNRPGIRQLAKLMSAKRGNPAEWEKAFSMLGTPSDIDEPEDRLARAVVLTRAPDQARRSRAVEELQALVADLTTNHPTAVLARELLVELLMKDGQSERASQYAAVSANTGDPGSIALYARSLLQSKKPEAAEWQIDRLAAVNPGDPREPRLRAQAIWDRSRPVEAASALFNAYSAREGAPGSEALGREVFQLLVQRGSEGEATAERLARRLAQKDPNSAWMLAMAVGRRGRYDEALFLLRGVLRPNVKPEDLLEAAKVAMSVAVASNNDPVTLKRVGEFLLEAQKFAPDSDDLIVLHAMLVHVQGDYNTEIALLQKVLKRHPEHLVALNNLACALSEGLKQPEEALKIANQLITYAGEDAEALDTRGCIYTRLQRYDEAIKDLVACIKQGPNGLRYFHLARAYLGAGQNDEARRNRDLARSNGLTVERVEPSERDDFRALEKL